MPDITMCNDKECPMAAKCYRNQFNGTKLSEFRQSWFAESPRKGDECDHFWERRA
jgi:hypothetical protein